MRIIAGSTLLLLAACGSDKDNASTNTVTVGAPSAGVVRSPIAPATPLPKNQADPEIQRPMPGTPRQSPLPPRVTAKEVRPVR